MRKIKLFPFLIILLLNSFAIRASHYSSGEIYYEWSPTASDSNRYEVCVNFYRNNNGANIPQQSFNVCLTSSCFPDVNSTLAKLLPPPGQASPGDNFGGWLVPGLDECANASDPNYKDLSIHKYCGFISLPGTCGDFKFTASPLCCRDGSTNLATAPNLYLEAKLNNVLGQSSSPQIQAPAGKAFCLTQPGARPFQFIQSAIDLDGDSIVYRFGHPQEGPQCGPGTNIPFSPGYSVNNPFPSSTGIIIDQKTGVFTFSPSQQGSYVVKIIVEDWRFDAMHIGWIKIGETVREIQIPVTANCNPLSAAGPRLSMSSSTNNAAVWNYTQAEVDSMKTAYNMRVFRGEDSMASTSGTLHQIPVFQGYQCFDSVITIEFNNNVRCASVDPTDFRLVGPDGISRPVVAVETNCQFLVSRVLDLKLDKPLDIDGNYVLQLRRGNDGNTLTNECGIELSEFYTLLIPVNGCPKPSYDLDGLTVENDLNIRLEWSGNAALQDPAILNSFDAWNIYRAESGQRPFQLLKVIKNPQAQSFIDAFAPNGYYVDNYSYDYQVQLVYNGKGRNLSRYCSSINLKIDTDQRTAQELPVYWNHYQCISAAVRNYDLYMGRRDTSLPAPGIKWQLFDQTTDSSRVISIPKANTQNQGTYALRVVARDVNGSAKIDSSESNWVYYFINYYPPNQQDPPQLAGTLIIPNIITPNDDGINDRFYINAPLDGQQYENISLSIFNRHGEEVYYMADFASINNSEQGWNGKNNAGQALASGVYFYVIKVENPQSNESETLQGTLTINRGDYKL